MSETNFTPNLEVPTSEPESLKEGTKLVGQSETHYQIDRVPQNRTDPILVCVYLASYVYFDVL